MASQKKKEKRASKNAKKKVKSADKSREQPEPTQSDANDANDANNANDANDANDAHNANAKNHGSGSNYKPPEARGETDDDDVISIGDSSSSEEDLDEVSRREEFLAQGARQDGMHIRNGVRNLPPEAAEYLQECSFIYRHAWMMHDHDNDEYYFDIARNDLLGNIKSVNAKLHTLKFDKQYVEEWKSSITDYKRPQNVRTDKENYVNSFKMNTGLIDTIALIKKEYDSFFDMIPRSKARKQLAKNITTTIYAQKSIVYDMGLTYKSIILPDIADKVFFIIQEGLAAVDKGLKSKIIAWLEGDDRDPTAVQRALIRQVPRILDTLFGKLQGKEPIDRQMKQLEKVQDALVKSNTSMSFEETDHQLGIEELRKMARALGKTTDKTFRDKLEGLKWDYIIYLDAQGWRCLIDDTPALRLKSKTQEKKLLEARPKRKLIEYHVPVDPELDKEKHPLEEKQNDEEEDGDEDEDESSNDSDSTDDSHATDEQGEDRESVGDAAQGRQEQEDDRESDEDVEMGGQDEDEDFPEKPHQTRPMQGDKTRFSPELNTSPPRGFSKCIVRGPLNPNDPSTPFGYIIGGRMIGLINSRFVVNVGTFNSPVHKILPGTEFGRKAGPELVKKMPLPMPKLAPDVADRHAADVLDLVGFVEDEPNSPQPKCRPVTYYAIIWRGGGSKPLWISRSDLISVCGKAWLDRKTQDVFNDHGKVIRESRSNVLEAVWRWNLEYLAIMKAKGLHPDTKKPLRESDRRTMPWLFQGPSMATRPSSSGKDEPKVKVELDEDDTAHIGLKAKRFKL